MTSLAGSQALIKLAARRDRVMLVAWIYLLTILVVSTGYSFKGLYKTAASREALFSSITHNAATLALAGPLYNDSLGALAAYKVGSATALAAGLMSIFIVIRHTRADEEAGRLELVGSTAVGRQAALAVGVLLAAAANVVVALLIFAGMAFVGLSSGGSAALGLAIGTCGIFFAAVAAVTAQLAGSARGARGIAIGVLAVSYLIMSAGAAAGHGGLRWLLWLSPLGWASQVRAYAGDSWPVLALPAAAAVVVAGAAGVVAARRDLGAGLMPPRPGPPRAARSLRSPLALAWRLQRVGLVGWAGAALAYGAALGSIARHIGSMLGSGAGVSHAITRLGGQSGLTDAYLAAMMSIFGLVAAAYAVSVVLRLRSEETAQQAEPVLATSVTRLAWAGSPLIIAVIGSAVVLAAAGLGTGLAFGLSGGDVGTQVPRLLGAAFAQLPAALVVGGVAAALFGLLPRSCVGGGWAALALAAVVVLLGPTLRLAQWFQDISPFTHVPKLPGGTGSTEPLAWLALIAVALAAAGLAGLRRRDIG
ncbi:MAG TPA: ABC transporter permease [Streptosporangiaceae bacterium]|nr:ABC transporter permease [Streptosporangiaceae bacterium]